MTWAIITFVLLLWIFGFGSEARARRKRKSTSTQGRSAYETHMNNYWCFKFKPSRKRDKDVIDYLNLKYYPESYLSHLLGEKFCGWEPYNEDDSFLVKYDKEKGYDPRASRSLKRLEVSIFRSSKNHDGIDQLDSLSRRDLKALILSLVRADMSRNSGSRKPVCA